MSIPAAITALLATETAYGLQLHKEIVSRLPHRAKTNVGQIYSTLDRLVRDELVATAGTTADGLPLYAATARGRERAALWLAGDSLTSSDWSEFLDVAFLAATLTIDGLSPIRHALDRTKVMLASSGPSDIAEHRLGEAMLAILADLETCLREGTISVHSLDQERPARGRRPRQSSMQ